MSFATLTAIVIFVIENLANFLYFELGFYLKGTMQDQYVMIEGLKLIPTVLRL